MGYPKGRKQSKESNLKRSETLKGNPKLAYWKGKTKGPLSEETKEKIRVTKLGDKNPMFGKVSPMKNRKHTAESKQKNREKHIGKKMVFSERGKEKKIQTAIENLPALQASNKNWKSPERNRKISESKKKQWQDLEWKEMVLKKVFASNDRKPNKTEIFNDTLIKKACKKEFIYSGDGKIFIAGKCPDWFNVNGKKQIIELFGDYFHSEKITGRTKKQEEKQRKDHFAKYGYKTLIIWEHELKNPDKVVSKIKEFNIRK